MSMQPKNLIVMFMHTSTRNHFKILIMLITIYAEYNFFYNFQHLNQLHKLKFTMQKYSTKI